MKIELSDQQLQLIDHALQQLPYNVAKPIIEHIEQQKTGSGHPLTIGGCPGFKPESSGKHYVPC